MSTSDFGEQFEIKNIGKIKSANVKINGLTIISGINDTGKSTIGKLLFSIVKAISRYEQDLNESKEQVILSKVEKLYFNIRRRMDSAENKLIRDEFYPRAFLNQIKRYFDKYQISLFEDEVPIDVFFDHKISLLSELPIKAQADCTNILLDIKRNLLLKEEKKDQIKRALRRVFFSEFQSEITPRGSSGKSSISYSAGADQILDIELKYNEITSLALNDDLMFKDVIYIDTPLLLQMYDLIQASDTLFENDNLDSLVNRRQGPKVALHIKDLISKIGNAKYFSNTIFGDDFGYAEVLKNISAIIKGGFIFEHDNNELIFSQKSDKNPTIQIRPVNTASGIKAFGIIQLLIQANMLNDTSLLIIDEPENHLHPQWQVEYAKMIVELVKSDIYVIINSHSPYMIQALKHFSEKNGIQDKTNFYFSEIDKNQSQANVRDVTNDLNVIFKTLAEPLKELAWQ